MKVFGIGNDVVPVSRFAKLAQENETVLLDRMFTDQEAHSISELKAPNRRFQAIASSFAVKESVLKALGTGLAPGITWKDIEVANIWSACELRVDGKLQTFFQDAEIVDWRVSSSASPELAIAFAILFTKA